MSYNVELQSSGNGDSDGSILGGAPVDFVYKLECKKCFVYMVASKEAVRKYYIVVLGS